MNFILQNKVAIGVMVLLAGLLYFYNAYWSGEAVELLTTDVPTGSVASEELLITLANLRTITLDNKVFSDKVFMSLTDFGVVIPPENVGRRNPFAPLGAGGAGATSSATQ